MKLNLGCGGIYKEGYVNVDISSKYKTDKIVDLNTFPYPFNENTFKEVTMDMILEHLDSPINSLKEIIRICKNKARILILVPHATSYANFGDIQHRHLITENSFAEFLLREYDLEELILISHKFIFTNKWKKYIPFKHYLKIFLMGIYDDMLFEFEVVKTQSHGNRKREVKR